MLTLDLENFAVQLKGGSIENVGAPDKRSTVKLYDVAEVDVREFGDNRVKLGFEDGEGNVLEIALAPEDAGSVAAAIDQLRAEGQVFE